MTGVTDSQKKKITAIVTQCLKEDIGSRDVTTDATISKQVILSARITAKSIGVAAGLEVAEIVFKILDPLCSFKQLVADGALIKQRTVIAEITGNGRALLKGERVALNFLARMSAVATLTNAYVLKVKNTHTVILDTRKTMPGLRIFDKYAVMLGGGQNHRFGLYDMILIKDNHIASVNSLTGAVKLVRKAYKSLYPIEVEVRNLDELREALDLKPERILLDNMNISQIRQAVKISRGRVPLEASGNITLSNVLEIARTGVDFISVGALTHSAEAMDISMEIMGW